MTNSEGDMTMVERKFARDICLELGLNPSGPAPQSQGERVISNTAAVAFWLKEFRHALTTPEGEAK